METMTLKRKKQLYTLGVLAVGLLLAYGLLVGKPKPEPTVIPEIKAPLVEVQTIVPSAQPIAIFTQGTISPRREIDLIAEVSGKVISVSPNFAAGGFFDDTDQLVKIDDSDYGFQLIRAKAKVADSAQLLATEKGRALQAKREWRELGSVEANDLFLRKPQLASAEASLRAAEADQGEAELNLQRTSISAPFNGRVRETMVDLGQYVNAGSPIARFYATDTVEVRLPLTDRQVSLLNLQLDFLNLQQGESAVPITLTSTFGGQQWQWPAYITRTDATIDVDSRVMYAVAEVRNPFDRQGDSKRPALTIGQFVQAKITGTEISNVMVIPRTSLRSENHIWVANANNQLQWVKVDVLQAKDNELIVRSELRDAFSLITSALNIAVDGMAITPKVKVGYAGTATAVNPEVIDE